MTRMHMEIMEQPSVLAGIEEANKAVLDKLISELIEKNINNVVFAGRGTSDHASIFGQYLLGIYKGAVSSLALPSCITLYDGALDLKNNLVIGVSQSGKAEDALAVLKRANINNAVTVAITNDLDSPMAKTAKYHLYCNAGPELSVAATKTFTAQMYLLALLTAHWSGHVELLDNLRKLPAIMDTMLKGFENELPRLVERFRYMNEGFVMSRGICFPVALEAALKVQETCYIKMKGYAVSDFYHGPLAQVDSDSPVLIFAPKGKAFNDIKAMIDKIKSIGAQVFVITDDVKLKEENQVSLLLPDSGSEVCTAFLFAVFSQYFAQLLSVSKDLNPDSPRLLKKVTITR